MHYIPLRLVWGEFCAPNAGLLANERNPNTLRENEKKKKEKVKVKEKEKEKRTGCPNMVDNELRSQDIMFPVS